MTNEQTENYLERCEAAFLLFVERNPDYPQTEANAHEMAQELRAADLSPDNADHLSVVWKRLHPSIPPPQPAVPESADPIEREALRMIADGEVSVAGVRAMSSHDLELRIRNLAFCRALELLPKPPPEPLMTRGDHVRAAVIAERASKVKVDAGITWDPATEVEKSRREIASGYANYNPEPEKPRGGTPHYSGMSFSERSGRGMTLPKTPSVAAILEQERKDHEFIDAARNKAARQKRVKANRSR